MAIGFSIYAVGLLGVFLIVSMLGSSDSIMTVPPRVLLQMVSVVVGYFAAFSLGGVLFAALSAMHGRILGYSLTGFVLGSTIYGCVAVGAELMEAEPPDWTTVREFTLLMGVLWGWAALRLEYIDGFLGFSHPTAPFARRCSDPHRTRTVWDMGRKMRIAVVLPQAGNRIR